MGGSNTKPCHLDVPFREHENLSTWTDEERQTLRNDAREAKPYKKCDFDNYNLLIVGPCQAGKSSFRNTIKSSLIGEVCYQADAGHDLFSLTRKFTIGPIRDKNGEGCGGFRFADMSGLDWVKVDKETIGGILDGKIPHNYELLNCVTPELAVEPIPGNEIHCMVTVLDGTKLVMMKTENSILQAIRDFRKQARERGIPVAVVVTHLDEVCSCVKQDLSHVFKCKNVEKAIMDVAEKLEIDPCRVFVVQNYYNVKDVKVNLYVDCLVLAALKHLLQYCREYADNWLDNHGN